MFGRIEYQFFVNMFDVHGKYSEKYLPGWQFKGFKFEKIETWVNQHFEQSSEEKSETLRGPSISYSLPSFFKESKILQNIENHVTTHLLVNWVEYVKFTSFKTKSNHAIGVSIVKDKYGHYHVFYLNKGHRSIDNPLYWFYIPPSEKKTIKAFFSELDIGNQKCAEEMLNQLISLKNTLSIALPQPPSQKRGSCSISNAVKNIARVESLIDFLDTWDFRGHLDPNIATEIKVDQELYTKYFKNFKKRAYHQAWMGAFEFAEMFEKMQDKQKRISLSILFYQGMFNRFHKNHFADTGNFKISFEIAGIAYFFEHCWEKEYFQALVLMLMHFSVCKAARRKAKGLYNDCILQMASLQEKISIDDALLDIMVLDLLADINARNLVSAYARYELLEKCIKPQENSLCRLVFIAIGLNKLDVLQAKLSFPLNTQSFQEFSFLLSLEADFDKSRFPLRPEALSAPALFLHCASEMNKEQTVKNLIEIYQISPRELNAAGESALDLAAQCGHFDVYQYLLGHAMGFIDSSMKHAIDYDQVDIYGFVLNRHLNGIKEDTFLYGLENKQIFEALQLDSLPANPIHSEFIFSRIALATVFFDHLDTLQRLLDKQLISVHQKNKNNQSLVHFVAMYDKWEIFVFLLAQGADLFALDNYGRSPFRTAIDELTEPPGFKIVLYYLENHFAALPEEDLVACLRYSIINERLEMVEKLLKGHAFSHEIIQLAFFQAISQGAVLPANRLMQAGASINEADSQGTTAMHLAAKVGGRILFWVYENKGDIYAANHEGTLPIQVANFSSIKFLLKQVINNVSRQRASLKLALSWSKDPTIHSLKQLGELINESTSFFDLSQRFNKWNTMTKQKTQLDLLYSVPSIQLPLQGLLGPLFARRNQEEKTDNNGLKQAHPSSLK